MSDTTRSLIAASLLAAGCLIGGFMIASGLLANWPGADTLMGLALTALVPATLALIYWLSKLGDPT